MRGEQRSSAKWVHYSLGVGLSCVAAILLPFLIPMIILKRSKDMVKPSFIPPADIRQLRDLMRYRTKLTNALTGEKNRALNCLTVSNLKLDDVFSDVFGKSSRSIVQQILEHPGEQFDVTPFLDQRCKHSAEEIQAAVDGAISREQAAKLRECLQHIDQLTDHRKNIEAEILRLAQPYPHQLELLRTIPGFSAVPLTAVALISEIGVDMSVFPSAKHLVSWAGCCPRNDQSSKKVKSTRISRAGCFLKPLLVQVANAVIKSDKHPECRERYRRIKARRGHKKAIIAVCRMLLTAIWNVLSKLEPYSAKGYLEDRDIHCIRTAKRRIVWVPGTELEHRNEPLVSVPQGNSSRVDTCIRLFGLSRKGNTRRSKHCSSTLFHRLS